MVHYDHEKKQENIKQRGHHDILYTHIQYQRTSYRPKQHLQNAKTQMSFLRAKKYITRNTLQIPRGFNITMKMTQ